MLWLQLGSIETAKRNNQLFTALKQGHKALTELQQEVSIEDAEKLMDDSAEAKAFQVSHMLPSCTVEAPSAWSLVPF